MLIAATVIISDLSFVSNNKSDYRFIEDLQLLLAVQNEL